jgi:uncharacterized protein YndB with AHSA1/START domain
MSDSQRVFQIHVNATPEATWAALTEPEHTKAWYYGSVARTTWEVGSPIEYVDEEGALQIRGEILSFDPPRSFGHTFIAVWGPEPDDQGSLTWTVEPDGGGSRITLVHIGGSGQETAEGSEYLLGAVKEYLESRSSPA